MDTRKIIILRGLQGSGKTTEAKRIVNSDPEHWIRFNCDDIRNMLGKYWVPSREALIDSIYWNCLEQATSFGYNIVIDNMNLNEKYVDEVKQFAKETNEWLSQSPADFKYEIEIKDFFNVPLQTCIERDAQRENPIGEKVIRNTYNKYKDKITPWKYLS